MGESHLSETSPGTHGRDHSFLKDKSSLLALRQRGDSTPHPIPPPGCWTKTTVKKQLAARALGQLQSKGRTATRINRTEHVCPRQKAEVPGQAGQDTGLDEGLSNWDTLPGHRLSSPWHSPRDDVNTRTAGQLEQRKS